MEVAVKSGGLVSKWGVPGEEAKVIAGRLDPEVKASALLRAAGGEQGGGDPDPIVASRCDPCPTLTSSGAEGSPSVKAMCCGKT